MDNKYRWEISPHPYNQDFDAMITNSDKKALEAILRVSESHLWDEHEGGERRVSVTHNPDVPDGSPEPAE